MVVIRSFDRMTIAILNRASNNSAKLPLTNYFRKKKSTNVTKISKK